MMDVVRRTRPDWWDDEADIEQMPEPPKDEQTVFEMASQRRELQAIEAAIAERIRELSERKARIAKQMKWLSDGMLLRMDALGVKRLKSAEYTIAQRTNPDKLEVTNEAELSQRFFRVTAAADKAAIRDYFKETGEIPSGCQLVDGGKSVVIR